MESLRNRLPRRVWRGIVGIVGGVVVIAGIIMIPYPGPGWAVVFVGLAILSQEFVWARHALRYARERYDRWTAWVKRRHWSVQSVLFIITCVVVVVTIWLVNGYGLTNAWLHLGWNWLDSPFVHSRT